MKLHIVVATDIIASNIILSKRIIFITIPSTIVYIILAITLTIVVIRFHIAIIGAFKTFQIEIKKLAILVNVLIKKPFTAVSTLSTVFLKPSQWSYK